MTPPGPPGRGNDRYKTGYAQKPRKPALPPADFWLLHGEGPVLEAARRGLLKEVLVDSDRRVKFSQAVIQFLKNPGAPVRRVAGGVTVEGRPRALAASVPPVLAQTEKDFFEGTDFKRPFLVVCPAGVQDPQNLGAVCRSVAAFGHTHLWLPAKGGAPLNQTVLNVSRGGLLSLEVTVLEDLSGAVSRFRDKGGVVLAADTSGEPLERRALNGPTLLLVGAEGEGLSPRLLAQATEVLSIPLAGVVDSLNVSAATAVLLWALAEQP